jgi:putative cardiolipin synthase
MALLAMTGCATLPKDVYRTPSTAIEDYESTAMAQLFEETADQYPGNSGFALLRRARPAFTSRIAMAAMAEKSLDLQYYIWEADTTGRILALRLIDAADRGVRVRILVDDNNIAHRDSPIASMDAHPNIEIRVFNPFANRGSRIFGYATDFNRLNHRMHNKIMVMDNALAIVGGRNIGDHYFGVHTEANFRDLDIAAAGPIVRDISKVFDYFWNGDWAYPIESLADRVYTETDLRNMVKTANELILEDEYPYPLDEDVEMLRAHFKDISDKFIWAPGQILWDDPADIAEGEEDSGIADPLRDMMNALEQEMLIESAYFVILPPGVEGAQNLLERGGRIRVLTNSLASNDVVAAHAGYAKTRKELIESGVEMYELRPDAGLSAGKHAGKADADPAIAALHTKAIVFDREWAFIGSFNLDPRSASINTEVALLVQSPELAQQLAAFMDEGVLPENSYRVIIDEDGDLIWITEDGGTEVRYNKEPETTFGQRFTSGFIKMLPVEDQL